MPTLSQRHKGQGGESGTLGTSRGIATLQLLYDLEQTTSLTGPQFPHVYVKGLELDH